MKKEKKKKENLEQIKNELDVSVDADKQKLSMTLNEKIQLEGKTEKLLHEREELMEQLEITEGSKEEALNNLNRKHNLELDKMKKIGCN